MSRVRAVYRPDDYPHDADAETRASLAELFSAPVPGGATPEIQRDHGALAIAAQNPRLALHLARLSRFLALDLPWSKRADLRELAIQGVNLHFKSDFSFRARLASARAAGITDEALAALSSWRTSALFDPEQRLVIEYAEAVASGEVPAELFARVVQRFGEKGAVEFTAVVAFWSFWAMFANATQPDFEPADAPENTA